MRRDKMELFVNRRSNRKRNAERWKRRLVVVSTVALLTVALWAGYRLRDEVAVKIAAAGRFVFDNTYFSVREIQVRGGEKVGGDEVIALTGLRQGMNIWKVQPAAIEKKLAQHPSVRRVLVRREFPRRVVVEIEERVPKAIVAMRRLYYVDADGVVYKEIGEGENVALPMLTGLRPDELTAADPKIRRRIQEALQLADLMAKDGHTLSEIHFDAADRLIVYTTRYPIALHMGSGDWPRKLKRLERILSLWRGQEERLAALDVSFRDQVVARLRRAR
jgi:cell division protein FtsQ